MIDVYQTQLIDLTTHTYPLINRQESQINNLPLNSNNNNNPFPIMYKGKNLAKYHQELYKKNKEILISAGIDPSNPPNPYQLIKEQHAKTKLDKLNTSMPYKWVKQELCANPQQHQVDPNASITIARAEMSRQGFHREMNQSTLGQNNNNSYRPNTNASNIYNNRKEQPQRWESPANNTNRFGFPNNNNNNQHQGSSFPKITANSNSSWFDELFDDSNSVQQQHPVRPNNNYQPSNRFNPPNNSYQQPAANKINPPNNNQQPQNKSQSYSLDMFGFGPQQNNKNNNNNNYQYQQKQEQKPNRFNNPNHFQQQQQNHYQHSQYDNNDNYQSHNNYNYNQHQQSQTNYNSFNNNNRFPEQKPPSNKPFRTKDLFRQQIQSYNHNPERQRPTTQRIYKNHEKQQGLVQCDKTKKLTTVKILANIETNSTSKNYIMGDVQMWEINNQYPDYKLKEALRNFPHVKDFKNNQKAIIKCALNGNDVFICIPTGGGKSLIFQLMTFIKKGIYLCVLPLVSLIFDQQLQAQKYQIQAYSLTGATESNKYKSIITKIANYTPGQDSILIFCTPEKIAASQNFVQLLTEIYHKGYLQHIIIDEVHCVSTWGKEFRKEYENLSALKEFFPKIPILGLTATVTEQVKQEIINKLRLKNCYFFQSSFNRPNLFYQVRPKSKRSAIEEICRILDTENDNSGIIYCLSKKQCEEMCKSLNSRGFKTDFYHADLTDKQKRQVQLGWMEDKTKIIIATIAFGMGINKADVRFVIHNSLSKSLEGYYQESGRAGRDGQPAKCILFYNRSDRTALQAMIMKNSYSSAAQKQFGNQQLAQMVNYCEEKYMCRRQFQLNYLGENDFDPANCNRTCDNCKKGLISKDFQCITQAKQIVRIVQFVVDSKDKITKAQLIGTLKGKDPNAYHKILKYPRLEQIRTIFKFWTNDHLEELILELLTHEILKQHAITAKIKFGSITNMYIEYNISKTNKFLSQVQTFPMRRVMRPQNSMHRSQVRSQKRQYNFDDFFSDSDQQKDPFAQKQTRSDNGRMDFSSQNYEQVDYSSADEMGIDLGQYQYEDSNAVEWQDGTGVGNNDWRENKIRLEVKGREKEQENGEQQKKEKQSSKDKEQRIKQSIDYIMKLFDGEEEDGDVII